MDAGGEAQTGGAGRKGRSDTKAGTAGSAIHVANSAMSMVFMSSASSMPATASAMARAPRFPVRRVGVAVVGLSGGAAKIVAGLGSHAGRQGDYTGEDRGKPMGGCAHEVIFATRGRRPLVFCAWDVEPMLPGLWLYKCRSTHVTGPQNVLARPLDLGRSPPHRHPRFAGSHVRG